MKLAALLLPLLLVFAFVARHDGLSRVLPAVTSGDEPHYLLAVSSLLYDRDLQLQDDYQRVRSGGAQAGLGYRGNELDHHTILVNVRTGEQALWQRVYDWQTHVRCKQPCVPFRKLRSGFEPGPDVIEVPAHPPAWPLLLAAMVAPWRPGPAALESDAANAVALLAWLALVVTALTAARLGFNSREALCAALLAGLASPWLAYTRSYFAEIPIGLFLALALWALVSRRPLLAGLGVVAAAALKPPFGLTGAVWVIDLWVHGRRKEALQLAGVVVAGGAGIAGFNLWLAHTPVIAGTSGFIPGVPGFGGLGVLLFDDAHGLLDFAPWALLALWVAARPGPDWVRFVALGALPYLLVVAATNAPDGGYCYGPRYWIPLIPWLALLALQAKSSRKLLAALALIGAIIAIPGALRYRHLFNAPAIAALRP
jgi:hypothetical protein